MSKRRQKPRELVVQPHLVGEDQRALCRRCARPWPCPSAVEGVDLNDDIAEGYGVNLPPMDEVQCARLELVTQGLIEDSGRRVLGGDGAHQIVWVATGPW